MRATLAVILVACLSQACGAGTEGAPGSPESVGNVPSEMRDDEGETCANGYEFVIDTCVISSDARGGGATNPGGTGIREPGGGRPIISEERAQCYQRCVLDVDRRSGCNLDHGTRARAACQDRWLKACSSKCPK